MNNDAVIVTKLLAGESAEKIESDISSAYKKTFYVKEKVLSAKEKLDICLEDKTPAYSVTSNLTKSKFSIARQGQIVLTLKGNFFSDKYSLLKNEEEIGHFKYNYSTRQVEGQLNGKEVIIDDDSDYNISYGGVKVGTVSSVSRFIGFGYQISVYDPELEDFIIAMTIIVNHREHVNNAENSD